MPFRYNYCRKVRVDVVVLEYVAWWHLNLSLIQGTSLEGNYYHIDVPRELSWHATNEYYWLARHFIWLLTIRDYYHWNFKDENTIYMAFLIIMHNFTASLWLLTRCRASLARKEHQHIPLTHHILSVWSQRRSSPPWRKMSISPTFSALSISALEISDNQYLH